MTPAEAWDRLTQGNARFAAELAQHPHIDSARRAEVAGGQHPIAAVLSCSDSRAAPELVFDQGLGDLFTVRIAGHVATDAALASLEYAVAECGVSVVLVLAHQRCGAIASAISAQAADAQPLPPLIAGLIAKIAPSVHAVTHTDGDTTAQDGDATAHGGDANTVAVADPALVGRAHLERTVASVLERSELISAAVADGSVAVVGATYSLDEQTVSRGPVIGVV